MEIERKLRMFICDSYLPLHFVAQMAGVSPLKALNMLKGCDDVEMRQCALDGHNGVWVVKNRQKQMFFNASSFSPAAARVARQRAMASIKETAELHGLTVRVKE